MYLKFVVNDIDLQTLPRILMYNESNNELPMKNSINEIDSLWKYVKQVCFNEQAYFECMTQRCIEVEGWERYVIEV